MIKATKKDYRYLMELVENYPEFRFDGWVRKKASLDYIKALEFAIDPNFDKVKFDEFTSSTKNITPKLLKDFGCKSVKTKVGGWTLIHNLLFTCIQMDLDPYFSLNVAQTVLSNRNLEDVFSTKKV